MRKSAKFPREIRQVTKIFAFSLATSEKPPRRPPRTAPLSPAARCVDVTSSRSSAPTASRATDRFNASRDDRRQPARAEPQRARQGVPRRRLRLRIRVYQQHGHVAHSRRRLGGGRRERKTADHVHDTDEPLERDVTRSRKRRARRGVAISALASSRIPRQPSAVIGADDASERFFMRMTVLGRIPTVFSRRT